MSQAIEELLKELDRWYQELPGGSERPDLLCKLAYLEFCGWIEHRMDSLVRASATASGVNCEWVEENLIKRTHGFKYDDHFRPMICSVIGEVCVIKIESKLEASNSGQIELFKATLGSLWKIRGALAHTSSGNSLPTQKTLNAPSWVINQQRILAKAFNKYEAQLIGLSQAALAL
jgi:hypothetical protein